MDSNGRKPDPQYHIQFGLGVRLAHESWYVQAAFQGALTQDGFRKLCKNLKVPVIHISGERYVDVHRFELAMTAISRIGQKDFVISKGSTSELDEEYVAKNWKQIVAELLAAKECNAVKVTMEAKNAAMKAAEALVTNTIALMPYNAQERRAQRLMSDDRLEHLTWLSPST